MIINYYNSLRKYEVKKKFHEEICDSTEGG